MTLYSTKGKPGQVEPNKLTGIVDGSIEAQAPAYKTFSTTPTPIATLENGQFLCTIPDTKGKSPLGKVAVLPGEAPETAVPYLVFSEYKVNDERQSLSDFIMSAAKTVDGVIYPKLIGLEADVDTFTTNTASIDYETDGPVSVGDVLYIGNDGYLSDTVGTNKVYQFAVTKVYTMPDGQPGFKVMVQNFVTV